MQTRKRPAPPQDRPPRNTLNAPQSSPHPRPAPISGQPRTAAQIAAIADSLGWRIAVPCRRCGSWLVAERSVRDHLGPVCRAKAVAVDA